MFWLIQYSGLYFFIICSNTSGHFTRNSNIRAIHAIDVILAYLEEGEV
jgi:hypothetical protein